MYILLKNRHKILKYICTNICIKYMHVTKYSFEKYKIYKYICLICLNIVSLKKPEVCLNDVASSYPSPKRFLYFCLDGQGSVREQKPHQVF